MGHMNTMSTDMKTFAASDLKTKIGTMFVAAAQKPVQITKRGTVRFVLMTEEEYRRFEAIEDAMWAARARQALKSGFVGKSNAKRLLREALAEQSA